MELEKMMTPMKRKKMSRASSRSDAFSVWPRIWRPVVGDRRI